MPPDTAKTWLAPAARVTWDGSIFGPVVVTLMVAVATWPVASVHTMLPWTPTAVWLAVKVSVPPGVATRSGAIVPPVAEHRYGAVPLDTAKTWLEPATTVAWAGSIF